MSVGALAAETGRTGRSQVEIQVVGIENPDHPQSRQTCTSGDGFIGGWLRVRGALR
jgi:hypothetical protein